MNLRKKIAFVMATVFMGSTASMTNLGAVKAMQSNTGVVKGRKAVGDPGSMAELMRARQRAGGGPRDSLGADATFRVALRNADADGVVRALRNPNLQITQPDADGNNMWHIVFRHKVLPVTVVQILWANKSVRDNFERCMCARNRDGETPLAILKRDSKKLSSFRSLLTPDPSDKMKFALCYPFK